MIDPDQRDNAECVWTWERLHEMTAPYCIRGDQQYVSLTYVPRYNQKYVDAVVHMNGWSKETPGIVWLN